MFKKNKRMELVRPGERRRREESDGDDNRITRRVLLARGTIGLAFVGLGGKLWQMQIAEGNEFRRIARENVIEFQRLKAPRGRILDRAGEPLAENRRSWSVQIIQSRLPDDKDQREHILGVVSQKLALGKSLVIDRTLVPVGSEAAVVNAISKRLEVDSATLIARLTGSDIAMLMLRENLSEQDAAGYAASMIDIPGVRVVNTIDYQLANHPLEDMPLIVKKDVDQAVALDLASNALYLPGVIVDDALLVRHYPAGPTFSHILGYVGPITEEEYDHELTPSGGHLYETDDRVGRGGIEQALETSLRGEKGARWVQIDANGVVRDELLDQRKDPRAGLSARLTLIRDFQIAAEAALRDGIANANADALENGRDPVGAGVAIAMNPQNGEILAMASLPTFDNQKFVDGISDADYQAYLDDPFEPLLDRSISGQFPPGSTFKPMMAAAGLHDGAQRPDGLRPDTKFRCLGRIRVPWTWDETQGNDYPCWELETGHGDVDVFTGISHSCDVYFYNVGAPDSVADNGVRVHFYIPNDPNQHFFMGMGVEKMHAYMTKVFGYGRASGIELAGEADGIVPNPKWLFQTLDQNWSIGDTINMSIGQGHLLCTPLQLLNSTASIAAGGKLFRPRLIRDLIREDGVVDRTFQPEMINDMTIDKGPNDPWIAAEHLATVREGMRRTVTEGTGMGKVDVPGIEIGAKSGTAEYGEAVEGKYKQGHAWFTAFGPFENPEICVAVMISGGGAGSVYSGPIANSILRTYFENQSIRDAARA